ncbi:MAG: succinoglycan biosynthesis transport protein ExoP [Pseudoalteromonas tetraodonis]|jgi:succinoglycan biosynthesis transport protein ExoP
MSEDNKEVKLHALDYWQVIRNRYGVILLAFFLVFMTATIITYMMPKEYLGRTTLQINREAKDDVFYQNNSAKGLPYTTFMQTQFAIIESKENLINVITKLKLMDRWNVTTEAEAYGRLVRKMRAEDVRGTDLVQITVYDPDADLAAALANEIADAYKNGREESEKSRSKRILDELKMESMAQEKLMEDSRTVMLNLMQDSDIIDIAGATPKWMGGGLETGSGQIVMRSKSDEYEAKANMNSLRTTIQTMMDLDGDALIKAAVELGISNPTIVNRYPEWETARLNVQGLRASGLGAKHPRILQMEGTVSMLKQMLVEAVDSTRRTLGTKMDIAEKTLASVSATKKSAEGDILDEKRRSVEYLAAKDEYDLHKTLLSEMKQRIAISSVNEKMPRETIKIHEEAVASANPAKPNVNLQLAIGAVLGLVFGIGLAFFLEYLDTSVRTLEDVERYLQVPVLAVIPREVGILHKQSGMSPDAEAYRILRTNIEFNRKSADANSITIVSGGAGEGKSTTLVNLAYICAQGGYNTLMIDGDLRRPKLHTFFDINNSVGLTNYLTTDLMLEDVILQTPVDNLYFMPSGILPADAAGILNSRRMSELIADVKSRFDLVLIDSPPILGVSDASVLASEVDLTMIVIQHRKLPRSMLVRVKQAIENVGGNLLGVVLNNVDVRSDSQYQYYTSYYTYYSPTNTDTKVKSRVHEVEDSYEDDVPPPPAPSKDAPAAPADGDYSDDKY